MEWGTNLLMNNVIKRIIPKGFLWKLSLLNIVIIVIAVGIVGWAMYYTACFLMDGIGGTAVAKQDYFNSTLFQYLIIFSGLGILIISFIHFYLTKKVIRPIHQLIASTKMLKQGTYPSPITVDPVDEIGELIVHYNELIEYLQKNEKLREKLIANISHELRTPMTNITGYLEALKEGHLCANSKLFDALHQQSMQIIDLIEQVEQLNEWNLQTNHPFLMKKTSIKILVEQSVQLIGLDLERQNRTLTMDVSEKSLFIHREGIRQVLNNILQNAVQYAEGEGPINIKGQILGDSYSISVSSPGMELKEADKSQIFDRFYRIDSSRNRKLGGSGLGLSIAKEIIENHKGTISVCSKNHRNTFTMLLPMK